MGLHPFFAKKCIRTYLYPVLFYKSNILPLIHLWLYHAAPLEGILRYIKFYKKSFLLEIYCNNKLSFVFLRLIIEEVFSIRKIKS